MLENYSGNSAHSPHWAENLALGTWLHHLTCPRSSICVRFSHFLPTDIPGWPAQKSSWLIGSAKLSRACAGSVRTSGLFFSVSFLEKSYYLVKLTLKNEANKAKGSDILYPNYCRQPSHGPIQIETSMDSHLTNVWDKGSKTGPGTFPKTNFILQRADTGHEIY